MCFSEEYVSDFSTLGSTETQTITEHDHGVETHTNITSPVLTTAPTGPLAILSFWKWILLMWAPRSHLVGWTLPPFDCSQILMIQTIGTLPETQNIPLPSTREETGTFAGAVLVSHAMYSSRRNRETQQRQAKSLKHADRVAKRKLMAQPEMSHALPKQLLRSRETRTDGHFAFYLSPKPSACTLAEPLKRVLQPVW